ncbi:MAG: hypothetical protein IJT47_03190 [Selenomonadaceae bacterium]|nr:hypothetical protein [Selenomonadaceae bacterium]MBQ7493417.1 hypothetical protein [Selenomonadaceae bacterium]
MFEDGARIDDILNVLRKPTLDKKNKKEQPISDTGIRYESRQSVGEQNIKFDFAKSSGGLL